MEHQPHQPQYGQQLPGDYQPEDIPPGGWKKFPAGPEILGAIALVTPFVITIESSTTRNGEVVSYSSPTALIGGILAAVCGVIAITMLGKTSPAQKIMRVLAAVALLGAGGYQAARGAGVFAGSDSASHGSSAPPSGTTTPRPPTTKQLMDACVEGDESVCAEARERGKVACAAEKPSYCASYGMLLLEGQGGPADEAGAFAAFRIGCDAGDMPSCTNMSFSYYAGLGVPKDMAKAEQYARQACEGGSGNGCRNYGVILTEGKKDLAGAREAFKRGCEVENIDGPACDKYGTSLKDGTGGPADAAAARLAYKRGCDVAKNKVACWNAAQLMWGGKGGDRDVPGALAAFRRACDYGDPDGCNEAGVILGTGDGVPKDEGESQRLYARACDGGAAIACVNSGVGSYKGTAGEKNLSQAIARFERACQLKSGKGCFYLGDLKWRGDGLELDRDEAKKLFARACELKFERGCKAAKDGL